MNTDLGYTKVTRNEREQELVQNAKVIWLSGNDNTLKSNIAFMLERKLFSAGFMSKVISEQDTIDGLTSCKFHETDNVVFTAHVAKMFVESGVVAICTLNCNTIQSVQIAKKIIAEHDFREIVLRNDSVDGSLNINPQNSTTEKIAQQILDYILDAISTSNRRL